MRVHEHISGHGDQIIPFYSADPPHSYSTLAKDSELMTAFYVVPTTLDEYSLFLQTSVVSLFVLFLHELGPSNDEPHNRFSLFFISTSIAFFSFLSRCNVIMHANCLKFSLIDVPL